MLVGGTGTGKSTLSKFLRQDPSLKIQQNEAEDYVFADGEEKIGNKNNHRSKTLFPHVDKDMQSGAQLVDCAGFEDTRHPMYDLLASFFTQKVFNKAQKMKIVVVESFERMRLSSDRTAFMRSIKQLAQLLQDDVAAFNGSIGLVATKADSTKSDEQLTKSVNVFLRATIESLQIKQEEIEARREYAAMKALERQILLVQFMAAGDKVAIFRRPDDLQSPWTLPPLRKNFNQIRDMMFKSLHYMDTNNQQQFQVSVAPETVIYIQNTLLAPNEQKLKALLINVTRFLITDFESKIGKITDPVLAKEVEKRREYSQNYSEDFAKINSPKSMITFFRSHDVNSTQIDAADLETRKYLFLHSAIGSDADSLLNDTVSMFGNRVKIQNHAVSSEKIYSLAATLLENSGKYEIYAKNEPLHSPVTSETYKNFIFNLKEYGVFSSSVQAAQDLEPTSGQLQALDRIRSERLTSNTRKELRQNFVSYTGRYILASQIKDTQFLEGQLLIVATQKFFVDKNLELIDAHLTILTPIVEVIATNRTITMRGSSGFTRRLAANEGARGEDGQPGYSSGDVNIFALDVANPELLQIRSFGGSGADGQAGGHGRDGIKSSAPTFNRLEGTYGQISYLVKYHNYEIDTWTKYRPEKKYWVAVVYNEVTNVENSEMILVNRKQSAPPTNGGDGGKGGAGALPGDLNVVLSNTDTRISMRNASGISGVGGRGGAGGRSAPVCAKTKLNCEGQRVHKNLVGFIPLNNPDFNIVCTNPYKFDCNALFHSGKDGRNGANGVNSVMQMCKHPMDLVDGLENLHIYGAAAGGDGKLENSGKTKEFLDFLLSFVDHEDYDGAVISVA